MCLCSDAQLSTCPYEYVLILSSNQGGLRPHHQLLQRRVERYTVEVGSSHRVRVGRTRQGTRDHLEPSCAPLGAGLRKNPSLQVNVMFSSCFSYSSALSAWRASADPEWLPKTPKTHRSGASRTPPGQETCRVSVIVLVLALPCWRTRSARAI